MTDGYTKEGIRKQIGPETDFFSKSSLLCRIQFHFAELSVKNTAIIFTIGYLRDLVWLYCIGLFSLFQVSVAQCGMYRKLLMEDE